MLDKIASFLTIAFACTFSLFLGLAQAQNSGQFPASAGGGGGTPGGANTNVQFNNGGSFGGDAGFTYTTQGQVGIALGTITTNNKALNITGTWNAVGTTFDAPLSMTITNTASAAASLLTDFKVGSTSEFQITPLGEILAADGTNLKLLTWGGDNKRGIRAGSGGIEIWDAAPALGLGVSSGNVALGAETTTLSWPVGTNQGISLLKEQANGTEVDLAWANAAHPQGIRLYNTRDTGTSLPTNYERGVIDWNTTANTFSIGTQAGGTGTLRNINLFLGGQSMTLSNPAGSIFSWAPAGTYTIDFDPNNGPKISNSLALNWSLGPGSAPGASIYRVANQVVGFGPGGSGTLSGWMQWGGQARVTADVTQTSTTTLTNVTGLSVSVQAGRTYSFEADLSWTDAAAGGIQAAIGGTATATNIIYDGWIIDSAANGIKGNAQATALGGAVASSTTTGTAGHLTISGTITVNAAGTLTVQSAQNTSNATSTTIKRGSRFLVYDMP